MIATSSIVNGLFNGAEARKKSEMLEGLGGLVGALESGAASARLWAAYIALCTSMSTLLSQHVFSKLSNIHKYVRCKVVEH